MGHSRVETHNSKAYLELRKSGTVVKEMMEIQSLT